MIRGVPYDAEVEYLESTGTQYIDTGVAINCRTDTIDCRVKVTSVKNYGTVFAVYEVIGGGGRNFGVRRNGSQDSWQALWGSLPQSLNLDTMYDIHYGYGTNACYINDMTGSSSVTFEYTKPLYIFAFNNINGASLFNAQCLYSFSIGRNGVLVRDFIPVRFTNEQGVSEGAMYDRVTRRLFRNQGTGAFLYGPDVATPVMGLHMFQKPPLTTLDYVQDGLMAHWDGIENAGRRTHSHTPANWKDLTGNGYDGIIGANVVVMDNCMSFNGVKGEANAVKVGKVTFGSPEFVTFETVFIKDRDAEASVYNEAVFGQTEGKTSMVSLFVKGKLDVQYRQVGLAPETSSPHLAFGSSPFRLRQLTAISFLYGADSIALYMNGERVAARTNNGTAIDMTSTNYNFYIGGDAFGPEEYTLRGRVFGLRIYNRALTAAEVAANYAVDKERFKLP